MLISECWVSTVKRGDEMPRVRPSEDENHQELLLAAIVLSNGEQAILYGKIERYHDPQMD